MTSLSLRLPRLRRPVPAAGVPSLPMPDASGKAHERVASRPAMSTMASSQSNTAVTRHLAFGANGAEILLGAHESGDVGTSCDRYNASRHHAVLPAREEDEPCTMALHRYARPARRTRWRRFKAARKALVKSATQETFGAMTYHDQQISERYLMWCLASTGILCCLWAWAVVKEFFRSATTYQPPQPTWPRIPEIPRKRVTGYSRVCNKEGVPHHDAPWWMPSRSKLSLPWAEVTCLWIIVKMMRRTWRACHSCVPLGSCDELSRMRTTRPWEHHDDKPGEVPNRRNPIDETSQTIDECYVTNGDSVEGQDFGPMTDENPQTIDELYVTNGGPAVIQNNRSMTEENSQATGKHYVTKGGPVVTQNDLSMADENSHVADELYVTKGDPAEAQNDLVAVDDTDPEVYVMSVIEENYQTNPVTLAFEYVNRCLKYNYVTSVQSEVNRRPGIAVQNQPGVLHLLAKLRNKMMHIWNGNGGPSCSSTWPFDMDSDDSRYDGVLEDASPTTLDELYIPAWWPGRKATWLPPEEDGQLAQSWPVVFDCNMCGEPLQVHSTQHATVGLMLDRAADALVVHAHELVAIDAGDILARSASVANLTKLDIDFHIEGGGGRPGGSARSRSRTPARSVAAEVAIIQPDITAFAEVDGLRTYLVVLRALPKGRKYYPLYCSLDAEIGTLRWDFGRVARRGVATFSFWQEGRRFHDHERISTIDRTKYLEVWKQVDEGEHDQAAPAAPDQPGLVQPQLEDAEPEAAPLVVDPYMCPDCIEVRQTVDRLQRRVTFIEDLLEVPARLRLRGGGKKASTGNGQQLPDCYEGVLARAQQLCGSYSKMQIKTILKADLALCSRLHKVDDASLIRILNAAGKRVGLLHQSASPAPGARERKDQSLAD